MPAIIKASENHSLRVQTNVLNDVIMDAVAMNPTPTHNGSRLKIYYATQVSVKPPSFVVFVNDPELMHFSYERFLETESETRSVLRGHQSKYLQELENKKV